MQVQSSNTSNNGATQAQSGSEPADMNHISSTKRDSKMEQLDVPEASPKTFIVPLPNSQKSQQSNREPASQW